MANQRKKKSSRAGPQQINRHFHFLAPPLRLVNRTKPATQENRNRSLDTRPGNAGGRRSTDKDAFELYDSWLCLSTRERQVIYLTCQGYKNDQIAFQMGVTVGTIKSYLQHVFFKLDVRSKTDLRLKFYKAK